MRPSVLGQLDPPLARLVNFLPAVDDANEAMLGRLFAHGGLAYAEEDADGLLRARIRIPAHELIYKPGIIVMRRTGELALEFQNEDRIVHTPVVPSEGDGRVLVLPGRKAGVTRLRLDQPGMYAFLCPVGDHAGRGMLGVIIVLGEPPPHARLDRPRQRRP
ncbi:MAG: MSMEG_3727 family PQQ-associated protein [Gemmatimonadota bacterium]